LQYSRRRNIFLFFEIRVNDLNEAPETTESPLPANRAFVVQFRPAMPDGTASFQGRVEHIASGQAEFFWSEQELRNAFTKLLSYDFG